MKKIVLLGLLIISGSLIADDGPVKNENGLLAIYKNLSEEGKRAYICGRTAGEVGRQLKKNWKNLFDSSEQRDGFSLGYFHGKVIHLNKKFAK